MGPLGGAAALSQTSTYTAKPRTMGLVHRVVCVFTPQLLAGPHFTNPEVMEG